MKYKVILKNNRHKSEVRGSTIFEALSRIVNDFRSEKTEIQVHTGFRPFFESAFNAKTMSKLKGDRERRRFSKDTEKYIYEFRRKNSPVG